MLWSMNRSECFVLLVVLCLLPFISGCQHTGVLSSEPDAIKDAIVYKTDSDEWHVTIIAKHLFYAEAIDIRISDPWIIPTREDASILHKLEYPSEERFITSDGYTFAMPSASVSKAGQKTKYSVLGLWKRKIIYDIAF